MYVQQCTDEELKKIYNEFGVTEETIQRDIQILKEWLEKQPHLPGIKDEEFLRLFFLRCKTSLEQTKCKLERYCITKAHAPNIFTNRDPKSLGFHKTHNVMNIFFVPKLTPEGHRVMIYRANDIPRGELPSVSEYLKWLLTQMLLGNQVCGYYKKYLLILDMRNVTAATITMQTIIMDKFIPLCLKHIPLRIEQIYLMRTNPAIDPLVAIACRISKKIRDTMIIWKKDAMYLAEVISKDVLPIEYGGTEGPIHMMAERWANEMQAPTWKEWLDCEEKWVADLTKKPTDREVNYDVGDYGLAGSFRQITID